MTKIKQKEQVKEKNPERVKQGKKNRKSGSEFERLVRKDLEEKGWIVSKWMNNVEFYNQEEKQKHPEQLSGDKCLTREDCVGFNSLTLGKLIPAKHKFCGVGRPMAIGTGFTDFICFRIINTEGIPKKVNLKGDESGIKYNQFVYEVIGVEAKSNGIIDKVEKEKCKWLLENNIFSRILIASKGEKRGQINYEEFEK
jgi:hypothetical protein